MTAPGIFLPVAPVKHNVVYRYVALAESAEGIEHFGGSLVALAALPVAHRPFGHNRRLAREFAVAANYSVHIVSGDEVPVHTVRHLAPPGLAVLPLRIHDIISP